MIRTGIPVSVWEREEPAVMTTAVKLLNAADADDAGSDDSVLIAGGSR